MSTAKPMATVREHPAKTSAPKRHVENLRTELRSACDSLQGAADVLEQLHGLFDAIRKLGGKETQQLARIGANLAIEWADTLDAHAERAIAQCNTVDNGSSPTPATPTTQATAPVAVLSMAAYDTATLHLEKAETLAEMLDTLGHGGLQRLGSTHLASAISCLIDELTAVRKALELGRPRGDA